MVETTAGAIDDKLLKKRLDKALFRSRSRAFMLVVPLLLFLLVAFVGPIIYFLTRAFVDDTFATLMPETTAVLAEWDSTSEPTETMYAAVVADMVVARENKTIGKVATRVNRDLPGTRSLFTSSARKAAKLEAPFKESLPDVKKKWADIEVWQAILCCCLSGLLFW